MTDFFTADHHFGHANIIKHCSRPFPDVETMDAEMIRLWNETVAPGDRVFHLGDFCWGNTEACRKILGVLNGTKILIRGNHDRGPLAMKSAGFDTVAEHIGICPPEGLIYLTHEPVVPEEPDVFLAVFCGHVHEEWKSRLESGLTILNVGVDVRGFKPVSLDELLKELP